MGIILNKECVRIITITNIAALTKIFLIQMLFNRFTEQMKSITRVKSLCLEAFPNGYNFKVEFFRNGINNDITYLNGNIRIE